ncbi:hypothetical protein [Caldiplasma sukawensis]
MASLLSNPLFELLLIFVDGLLFGLAFKKGLTSVILIIVAVLLAEYINFSVIPASTLSTFETDIKNHIIYLINNINTIIPFHTAGAITVSVIVFVIGLVIGYLKG